MNSWSIGMLGMVLSMAFLAGYTGSGVRASIPPPGCLMYECKTVDAYWVGKKDYASGVHFFTTGATTSDGVENIFTPQSNDKKPRNLDDPEVKLAHWIYSSCTPWCGLDANNKWQAIQEVANLTVVSATSYM